MSATPDQILAELVVPGIVWSQPVLLAITGLPGTGKTTLASTLAARHSLVVLTTDRLRQRYGFSSGPATLEAIRTVAATLLMQKRGVLVDGTSLARAERQRLAELARHHNAPFFLIETTANEPTIRKRLAQRMAEPEHTIAMGNFVITPEHFARIVAHYEPPEPDECALTIETANARLVTAQLTVLDHQLSMLRELGRATEAL